MLEIEYIPLKTPDGTTCGHACVRGGYVELQLRAPIRGSALVLTENGSSDAAAGARIPVSAQVSAVALHEQGQLRCCGFSRTTALDAAGLRRRLHALSPAPPKPAPQPAPAPEPVLSAALVDEIAAGIPDITPPPAPQPAPKSKPAPTEAAGMDDASRAAMAARAKRVYKRIETPARPPVYAPTPEPVYAPAPEHVFSAAPFDKIADDIPDVAPPSAPVCAPEPPSPFAPPSAAEQWARDTDALLADAPPACPVEPAPVSVPNPFPHIFPGAVFTQEPDSGALNGVWLHGTSRAHISAVPGAYSPQPPACLTGYTRYIRARSGGYWVKVIDD